VPNRPALLALRAVVPVSNILFGTDFPFLTAEHHVTGMRTAAVFSDEEARSVDRDNAARLLAA
jgi:predicted TIM-barrel fold metal-dependent hydrolase